MTTYMELCILILLVIILFALMLTLHKVRRIHIMNFEICRKLTHISSKGLIDHFQQLGILENLKNEFGFEGGLPLTRGWAASPDLLLLIAQYAKKNKPEIVVECSSGTSTVVLAKCMKINGSGHVYSLDHDPEFAQHTRESLIQYGLEDWATVITAPLTEHQLLDKDWLWYSLNDLKINSIDLLVIDGPPMTVNPKVRYPAGPILFPKLEEKGVIFIDDADRDGEKWMTNQWMKEFPTLEKEYIQCEKGCIKLRFISS